MLLVIKEKILHVYDEMIMTATQSTYSVSWLFAWIKDVLLTFV